MWDQTEVSIYRGGLKYSHFCLKKYSLPEIICTVVTGVSRCRVREPKEEKVVSVPELNVR